MTRWLLREFCKASSVLFITHDFGGTFLFRTFTILTCHAKLADGESEALLRRAFIVGLSQAVSCELSAVAKIDQMTLASMVEKARALMAEQVGGTTAAATVQGKQPHRTINQPNQQQHRQCYRSGGPHLVRRCKSSLTCWTCGAEGHQASECSGNERGEASAPGAFSEGR